MRVDDSRAAASAADVTYEMTRDLDGMAPPENIAIMPQRRGFDHRSRADCTAAVV